MASNNCLYSVSNKKEGGSEKIGKKKQRKETGSGNERQEIALSDSLGNSYLERVGKQRRTGRI